MRTQPYQASQDQRRTEVIQLADGRLWNVPSAADVLGDSNPTYVSEYLSLLQAVALAEDVHESRLGELALTIHLLDHEFQLTPNELRGLLSFPSGSKEQARFQDAIHAAYLEHISHVQKRQGCQQAPEAASETSEDASPAAWISALTSRIGRLFYRRVSSQKGL